MRLHDKLFHRIQVRLRHLVKEVAVVAVFTAGCKAPFVGARSNDCGLAVVSVVAVGNQPPIGGFSLRAVGERPEVDTENWVVTVGGLGVVQYAQVAVVVHPREFPAWDSRPLTRIAVKVGILVRR